MSEFASENEVEAEDFFEFEGKASGGPPVGVYLVTLTSIKRSDHPEYGPGVRFTCTVAEGEHQGSLTCRTGKPEPTAKNITGRLVSGIIGKDFKPGERMNLAGQIGKKFEATVGLNRDGETTRLEKLKRIPSESYA